MRAKILAVSRKAILSLRLRLHSGLRQSGSAFGAVGFMGLLHPSEQKRSPETPIAPCWYSGALSALG
jgi:hypothetical protein